MRGAGTPFQLRPPSTVRTTDVHGAVRHGAEPSTQPVCAETNVTDSGRNPARTGPPGGPSIPCCAPESPGWLPAADGTAGPLPAVPAAAPVDCRALAGPAGCAGTAWPEQAAASTTKDAAVPSA